MGNKAESAINAPDSIEIENFFLYHFKILSFWSWTKPTNFDFISTRLKFNRFQTSLKMKQKETRSGIYLNVDMGLALLKVDHPCFFQFFGFFSLVDWFQECWKMFFRKVSWCFFIFRSLFSCLKQVAYVMDIQKAILYVDDTFRLVQCWLLPSSAPRSLWSIENGARSSIISGGEFIHDATSGATKQASGGFFSSPCVTTGRLF